MADFVKRCKDARDCKNHSSIHFPTEYDVIGVDNDCEGCIRAFENKVSNKVKNLKDNFQPKIIERG